MDITLRNMTSLYLVRDEQVLCLYRIGSSVADRKFIGSAGGHFEPSELNDPRACVLREMAEELGLKPEDIEGLTLRYITHRLKNGQIRQNYYFFAELRQDQCLHSNEGHLSWFDFSKIPELDMPVSAKHMLLHYIRTGRFTDHVYCGITKADGTVFEPMSEFEG